jgi:hypothetical protein
MGMTAAEDIVRVLRGETAMNVANQSALGFSETRSPLLDNSLLELTGKIF